MSDQQTTFPPPNYIQVESQVEGIVIYAPKPEKKETIEQVVEFSCPNCLSKTAYSPAEGGLKCSSCGYYEPPKKKIVGRSAEQFEFNVEVYEEQQAHGWGVTRQQMECQNCYAITTLPEGTLTSECPFCGSRKVVNHNASHDQIRPRYLIPFTLTDEDAAAHAGQWLGNTWMVPAELRQKAKLKDFTGIYLPFWTFDAGTMASWKAEVGYKKQERYYSGGEWKTRTVTEWKWESGNVSGRFDDHIVSGSSHVTSGVLESIANFRMAELAEYEPKFLAGWQAQAYEVELDKAWATGREQMRDIMRERCRADALSGEADSVRNMTVTLEYRDEKYRYVLLPVYLSTFNFQDETYQFVVNGQTGSVGGSRPVDWTKVYLVTAAWLSPAAILGLLTLPALLLLGPFGFAAGVLAFFAFNFGIKQARDLVGEARKIAAPDGEEGVRYIGGIVPWKTN